MLPELIPYIIRKDSSINTETGESKGWSYDKKFRLYHVPSRRILKLVTPIERIYFVDEYLEDSIGLVLECKDTHGNSKYTIVNKKDDLDSLLWFDYLKVITPQLIVVRKDSKWGVVNDMLQMRCFFEYDSLEDFISLKDNSILIVGKKNGKYGMLNENLAIKFPFNYSSITCNPNLGIFVLQGELSTTILNVE